jgi:hypothetical protein
MVAATLRRYDAGSDQLSFEFKYNLKEKEKLNEIANRNGNVDIEILRRIALWKLDRVLEVSCATLERLQSLATDDHLRANSEATQSLIMELLDCAGVGLPMASTILKFLRPDIFPIIDVRAYRAFCRMIPRRPGRCAHSTFHGTRLCARRWSASASGRSR